MSEEIFQVICKINKELYNIATPYKLLVKYGFCIHVDKRYREPFPYRFTVVVSDYDIARRKLLKYIRFWIVKCPDFCMVRKTDIIITKRPSGGYTASCFIDIRYW